VLSAGTCVSTNSALRDRRQLSKDCNRLLDEVLTPGEPIAAIIRGISDSAMIATGRRIFVFKKGWLAGRTGGKSLTTWDYANVSGINLETSTWLSNGRAIIFGPGVPVVDVKGMSAGTVHESTNAIILDRKFDDQSRNGAALIRNLIAEHQHPRGMTQQEERTDDVFLLLKRLGELRDSGVITSSEFEEKKKELLARL
jgi:hypothetical protein